MPTESKIYIPWVEKYRPTQFDDIVLDQHNKTIFSNIIKSRYIPNLLFYGPPGTGKTTTIINLISKFQQENDQANKGLMIHLNASDERGIDIIRNQINMFVNSKTLFSQGVKFIVLDEVDYMTKNAQLALKYLLQEYQEGIRFCLICNYISKIDESLQTEFVRLRFNQLPKAEIIRFLDVINTNERLGLTQDHLKSIQNNYKSDIRSMINYMQSNQSSLHAAEVINNEVYDRITALLQPEKKTSFKEFSNYMHHISQTYNIDIKSIIKDYFNYLIRHKPESITEKLLTLMETVTHNTETNMDFMLHYIIKGGPPPFKTPGVAFW